jgi:cytochrome c peroxidase
LQGQETAMSRDEVAGAILFFGKAGCNDCHTGPALSSMTFYALGMNDLDGFGVYGTLDAADSGINLGRGGFTGNPEDNYKFKTPQLYNLKDVTHLGHGGTFRSVREVINYKNRAVAEKPNIPVEQLADQFKPLELTQIEIEQLVAFIENALYDPDLRRYEPTQSQMPTGLCPVVNDPMSRLDLGCAAPPAL